MTSSYVNDLRLNEMATGDASGTWGTVTNTNLELIGEALGYGTEAITTNADTHTSTVADGSTDPARAMFIKYTGTLDSTCTITIAPNTLKRLHFIHNATSGSQSIIIKQGSGATITIPTGDTKAVYLDGAGSGAAVTDAFASLSVVDLKVQDDLSFTSDSAVISFGADADTTLTHTDGSGLTLNGTNKLMFNDASQFIQGASATVLDIAATDEIELTATLIDVVGNQTVSGTLGVTGIATFTDDIIIGDGKTIGSASDVDAMTIASNGQVTFTQTLIGTALDISGDIDVDGTTNLDVVDVDGAVNFAADVTFADGADLITATAGNNNTRIGTNAGFSIASGGNSNVCIGDEAGRSLTTGDNNIAIGHEALYFENAHGQNIAIGYRSLKALDAGAEGNNVAIGYLAGQAISSGIHNTLIGTNAGDALTDADTNTAIGSSALTTDTLGSKSTAVGHSALEAQNFTSATTTHNTAVGADSGKAISTGTTNSTFGSQSGAALTTGTHNVLIGSYAGAGGVGNLTTGLRNILIGHGAGQNNGDDSDNIAIGYETNCQGHQSAIVIGTNVDSVASNTFTFGKGDGNDRVSNGFTVNATFARVSDVRYKKEIKDNDDCGLDFINDLRPVTFKWKAKSEISTDLPDYDATKTEADHKEKLYGLIAQEVKEALDKNNITDFGGWEKEKTSGINKVAQAMFIYPLIKAVQELSAQVTALTARVTELEGE
jgi:hypothetical protein